MEPILILTLALILTWLFLVNRLMEMNRKEKHAECMKEQQEHLEHKVRDAIYDAQSPRELIDAKSNLITYDVHYGKTNEGLMKVCELRSQLEEKENRLYVSAPRQYNDHMK